MNYTPICYMHVPIGAWDPYAPRWVMVMTIKGASMEDIEADPRFHLGIYLEYAETVAKHEMLL